MAAGDGFAMLFYGCIKPQRNERAEKETHAVKKV
jgi:hypothetical protein